MVTSENMVTSERDCFVKDLLLKRWELSWPHDFFPKKIFSLPATKKRVEVAHLIYSRKHMRMKTERYHQNFLNDEEPICHGPWLDSSRNVAEPHKSPAMRHRHQKKKRVPIMGLKVERKITRNDDKRMGTKDTCRFC